MLGFWQYPQGGHIRRSCFELFGMDAFGRVGVYHNGSSDQLFQAASSAAGTDRVQVLSYYVFLDALACSGD